MKFLIVLVITLCFTSAKAQTEAFAVALTSGNSTNLSTYFDKELELTITTNNGLYSKTQAKLILDKFFKNNPPTEYTKEHNGGSKERFLYEIGNLKCGEGIYRVYILYNLVQEKPQIIELRIEKE